MVWFQYGIYDVAWPGPDLAADFAKQLWKQYEGILPAAAVGDGSWTPADWQVILLHIQAQSIHHPEFNRAARDYIRELGSPDLSGDEVRAQRAAHLPGNTALDGRGTLRTRAAVSPGTAVPGQRQGLHPAGRPGTGSERRHVPAVRAHRRGHGFGTALPCDDNEAAPFAEHIVDPETVITINEATLDTVGVRCVIGDPHDRDAIAAMTTGPKLAAMPDTGACLGTRQGGPFDWARPVRQFAAEL